MKENPFSLIEMLIVVGIIGLLTAIALPNFNRARQDVQRDACINNLRMIDSAIEHWALENNETGDSTVTDADIQPYLRKNIIPTCPSGGIISYSLVSDGANCDIHGTQDNPSP